MNQTISLLKDVAKYAGVSLDDNQLKMDIQAMFDMENDIANKLNTREKDRRIYNR